VRIRPALLLASLVFAAACTVGPDYKRPATPLPPAYKELPAGAADLRPASPHDEIVRGKWWEVFGDRDLNALEEQINVSNLTIAQAEAQFRGARAAVRLARAGLFPSIVTSPSAVRSSIPGKAIPASSGAAATSTLYQLPVDFSWEIDVFGRLRRTLEGNVALAEASAADLEAVRLAIQAELAADYFTIHGVDAQRQLLETTAAGYETALRLTKNRRDQGVVSGVDVALAETQLETTRAQLIDLGIARSQFEHAIATLIGKMPEEFNLKPHAIDLTPPEIPVSVPSELLERRPDIAGAERRIASANAQIGVARAAFFPIFTLSAAAGYQSSTLSNLISLPTRFWSLGPAALETIFSAGKRRAASDQAIAAYDGTVAGYRETVLTALQDVEDNLVALRLLGDEAQQQQAAVNAAERSLVLARNRYEGGITTYLEVVTAQSAALSNERVAVDVLTRRMVASVNLVRALGGGWKQSGTAAPSAAPGR
jgi:NodT family efflux transporter outer membrane factor (OMF) lipoprotein